MRKIIVGAQVSMDGVMQAPGAPTEDPTKGFKFGGWVMPYFDQEFGEELDRVFKAKFDLLRRVLALLRRRRSPWRHRQAVQGHQEVRGFALKRGRYELGGLSAPARHRRREAPEAGRRPEPRHPGQYRTRPRAARQ
jgi:hypothetical protein